MNYVINFEDIHIQIHVFLVDKRDASGVPIASCLHLKSVRAHSSRENKASLGPSSDGEARSPLARWLLDSAEPRSGGWDCDVGRVREARSEGISRESRHRRRLPAAWRGSGLPPRM